jgi:hypothetical protein
LYKFAIQSFCAVPGYIVQLNYMSESDTLQTEHICVYHFDPCFVPDFCRTILTSYFLFNLSTLKNYCSLRLHACRHIHFRLLVSMQTLYISHVSAVADMSIDRVLLLALSACLLISDMSIFRASATCRHVYFLCIVCYQTCPFSKFTLFADTSIFHVSVTCGHVHFPRFHSLSCSCCTIIPRQNELCSSNYCMYWNTYCSFQMQTTLSV